MELEIISPQGTLYQGTVERVSLPGAAGRFDILPKHAPLIALLQAGEVIYHTADGDGKLTVQGGFAEIKEDHLSVCVE